MRRAGLAILFGFSIYLGSIAAVTLAAEFGPSLSQLAMLIAVALCHCAVGFQILGEGLALSGDTGFFRLLRLTASIAITVLAVLAAVTIANARPIAIRSEAAELLLLLSLAGGVLGLALSARRVDASPGDELPGRFSHRPPRR